MENSKTAHVKNKSSLFFFSKLLSITGNIKLYGNFWGKTYNKYNLYYNNYLISVRAVQATNLFHEYILTFFFLRELKLACGVTNSDISKRIFVINIELVSTYNRELRSSWFHFFFFVQIEFTNCAEKKKRTRGENKSFDEHKI